ncbi:MAG: cytochrome c [Deltaproteobacteria bacterium]|nr:cytochrome c [Deltaproteobacteria bacterium]
MFGGACSEQLLNPMADHRQPRERAYRPSDFYADGLAMRAPPAGTVPRERRTMNPTLTTGIISYNPQLAPNGERVARYASKIPLPVTPALMALGRKRYDITCGTCHGPLGDGDSIVAKQMSLRPPPSLHLYADRAPGYIFEVATRGFGLMGSYAAELTVEERWAVVAYIRALQVSQNAPVGSLPADARRQLEQEKP